MVSVRFSDVHKMILEAFPGNSTSSVEVAKLLVATFPSCEAKRDIKGKKGMFYVGLQRKLHLSPHQHCQAHLLLHMYSYLE